MVVDQLEDGSVKTATPFLKILIAGRCFGDGHVRVQLKLLDDVLGTVIFIKVPPAATVVLNDIAVELLLSSSVEAVPPVPNNLNIEVCKVSDRLHATVANEAAEKLGLPSFAEWRTYTKSYTSLGAESVVIW